MSTIRLSTASTGNYVSNMNGALETFREILRAVHSTNPTFSVMDFPAGFSTKFGAEWKTAALRIVNGLPREAQALKGQALFDAIDQSLTRASETITELAKGGVSIGDTPPDQFIDAGERAAIRLQPVPAAILWIVERWGRDSATAASEAGIDALGDSSKKQ